jgi:hypothetical protein
MEVIHTWKGERALVLFNSNELISLVFRGEKYEAPVEQIPQTL